MADENENTEDQAKIADLQKRLDALAAKNDELLTEVKTERAKRREVEEAKAEAEETARAKEEEAAAKSGDLDSLRASLEAKHKAALEREKQRADEAERSLNRLVVDGGIRAAADAAEIAPEYAKAVCLLFKDDRQIEVKDGVATVDGVPVADAFKEWAESDEGKVYKAAGRSTGGGAPGGGKSAGGTLADMSEADRMKMARENPQRFKELRQAG